MSDDEERGWRFDLDDLETDESVSEDVERESVSVENAAFVAAGVLLTVGAVVILLL